MEITPIIDNDSLMYPRDRVDEFVCALLAQMFEQTAEHVRRQHERQCVERATRRALNW